VSGCRDVIRRLDSLWPCIAHACQLCTSAQTADGTRNTMQPMMEMVAGSNVWYQAHVLRATAAKLRVLFPGDSQ
jgi:hypothetical protein